jgi:hypothetical protein
MLQPGVTYTDAVAAVETALQLHGNDDQYPEIVIRAIESSRDVISVRSIGGDAPPVLYPSIEIVVRLTVYPSRAAGGSASHPTATTADNSIRRDV